MGRKELEAVVDYVLNGATEAEFEVVVKACERRRREGGMFAKLGGTALGGTGPTAMAGMMSASVNAGIQATMGGMRESMREYVEKIIRRHAPEASDEQVAMLLDQYAPRHPEGGPAPGTDPEGELAAASASGLPPEALALMIRDFTSYALGFMPPSRQQELWENVPGWQDRYWDAFPPAVKAFVKARLEDRLDEEEFWRAVLGLLGL